MIFRFGHCRRERHAACFMDWRDRLALKSVRQADYAYTVLALILAWAKDRGKIMVNPCERGGKLYSGTRVRSRLVDRGRVRISATRGSASAFAVAVGVVDRAAPRRSVASHLVGL